MTTLKLMAGDWSDELSLLDTERLSVELPGYRGATGKSLSSAVFESDFDELAHSYHRLHRSRLYNRHILNAVSELVPNAARCLEIGCGLGDLTGRLARRCVEVVATDISRNMIDYASRRVEMRNVNFMRGDVFSSRSIVQGSFCVIIVKFVLHDYYYDVRARLIRLLELLRPGGALIVLDRFWEPNWIAKLVSLLQLEMWMWRELGVERVGHGERLRTLRQDFSEWFSARWRQHRAHEPNPTLEDFTSVILTAAFARAEIGLFKVNSRAFLASLRKLDRVG